LGFQGFVAESNATNLFPVKVACSNCTEPRQSPRESLCLADVTLEYRVWLEAPEILFLTGSRDLCNLPTVRSKKEPPEARLSAGEIAQDKVISFVSSKS
jgi:hypothetical protein